MRTGRACTCRTCTAWVEITCVVCGAPRVIRLNTLRQRKQRFCSIKCSAVEVRRKAIENVGARFWSRVQKTDQCWAWIGSFHPSGYGLYRNIGGLPHMAHRAAYVLTKGPIPEGLTIDHLCRVRSCVRPDHLEAVTLQENIRRASIRVRTGRCGKGHLMSEHGYQRRDGGQNCKECNRVNRRRRTPADDRKQPGVNGPVKEWRRAVLARLGSACVQCGAEEKSPHIHHIKSWADHPDLRFEPSNGTVLCVRCHMNLHAKWPELVSA